MNEQLPPLPEYVAKHDGGVFVWAADWLPTRNLDYYTADQMRDYARAALAAKPCTCPSGDGSLRWPCPVHPAPAPEAAKVPADPHLMTKHNALHMNHIALKAHADRLARALHTGLGALICAGSNDECQSLEVYAKQVMREALVAYDAAAPAPEATELERMTAHRAAFFMERFQKEEKMLGPNEQAALRFVIAQLESKPEAQHPDTQDAERYRWLTRDDEPMVWFWNNTGREVFASIRARGTVNVSGTFESVHAAIDAARGIGASGEAKP